MSMVLLCLADKLTINRVLLLKLSSNSDRLLHLIAYYYTLTLFS